MSKPDSIEQLKQEYGDRFDGAAATHYVAAPGRINLIGEHIDYSGLSVLPMALDRRILLVFGSGASSRVRIHNTDDRYQSLDFAVSSMLEPYPEGEWGNYPKAAVQELVLRYLELNGIDAVMHSDIPVASGLSSSSALVVAVTLALIRSNDIAINESELMELLAMAERYVGTEGGGMDQAICVGAVEGCVSRVDFDPVRLTATRMPGDWRVVVANSLVRAEKSGAAREEYNRRSRECREALATVLHELEIADEVATYRELIETVPHEKLLAAAESALPGTLGRRFAHVVNEAKRVFSAERAMVEADPQTFGKLMTESHASLRDDFAVSGPELDELVKIALEAGAYGARLTGAGFGGCVIALADEGTAGPVLSALQNEYYGNRTFSENPRDVLFVARPGGGAVVGEL